MHVCACVCVALNVESTLSAQAHNLAAKAAAAWWQAQTQHTAHTACAHHPPRRQHVCVLLCWLAINLRLLVVQTLGGAASERRGSTKHT